MAESIKRISDLEFRKVYSMLSNKPDAYYYEIVKWWTPEGGTPCCFTVCSWCLRSEYWEMSACGNRPFKYERSQLLFAMMKYAQEYLDATLELVDTINELGIEE